MKARGFRERCARRLPLVAELVAARAAARPLVLPVGADPELAVLFGIGGDQ